MSRYCASCGKLLADNAKFCTSCGAPVEQTTASDSQPAFEQTGPLIRRKPRRTTPRLSPRPRRKPRGRRDHAVHTRRERLAPTAAGSRMRARFATDPRSQKERHRAAYRRYRCAGGDHHRSGRFLCDQAFRQRRHADDCEVAKLHHDVDDDDLKPLGDPNSLYDDDDDDDDDEDGGEATLSEQNLYRRLSEYYDLLEDLDNYVRGCAQNFNGSYLEEDRTTRQNLADVAERTEDTIEQYYDIVEDLDVPTSSKNYSSWKDIIALYDDLDHRIDAICDAWEISLKYAKPADHKNEIVAPLSRDNVAGTNDNKYRLDFEERYPGAKPVEVN